MIMTKAYICNVVSLVVYQFFGIDEILKSWSWSRTLKSRSWSRTRWIFQVLVLGLKVLDLNIAVLITTLHLHNITYVLLLHIVTCTLLHTYCHTYIMSHTYSHSYANRYYTNRVWTLDKPLQIKSEGFILLALKAIHKLLETKVQFKKYTC